MKKIFMTLVLVLAPAIFFGQSMFDKFDGPEEITTVVVNKKMFEMMGNVKTNDKDAQQFLRLIKGLDNLRVFTTSDKKWSADMKATVDKHLKSNALEELMRVSDSGKNVKIYVKSGDTATKVKELLMFIEDANNETVLLSLTGNFDMNDISALTEKMSLPGGEELKKASKSNK